MNTQDPLFSVKESTFGLCIYHNPPVRKLADGGAIVPLRFPCLFAWQHIEEPQPVLERVAQILSDHWDEYNSEPWSAA